MSARRRFPGSQPETLERIGEELQRRDINRPPRHARRLIASRRPPPEASFESLDAELEPFEAGPEHRGDTGNGGPSSNDAEYNGDNKQSSDAKGTFGRWVPATLIYAKPDLALLDQIAKKLIHNGPSSPAPFLAQVGDAQGPNYLAGVEWWLLS